MKKIYFVLFVLLTSFGAQSQNLNLKNVFGKKEKADAKTEEPTVIDYKQSQFVMANQFLKASEVFWTVHKDGAPNMEIMTKYTIDKFAENVTKDEKENITKGTFRMATLTPQNNEFPLFYKSSDSKDRVYFIGNYFIKINRAQINSVADIDVMVKAGNVYEVAATSKSAMVGMNLEKVISLLKEYYTANEAMAAQSQPNIKIPANNTWELKGFQMTGEGKMINQYTGDDGKTRFNFMKIDSDNTIIYTMIRVLEDGAIDAMKKWKMPIGVVNQNDRYFFIFPYTNGGKKLYNAMVPCLSTHYFVCEEMLAVKDKPERVQWKKLEVIFEDEAEAKTFMDEVRAIRATVKTPDPNASTSSDKKEASGFISFKNYSDQEHYKIEGSSSSSRMSGSMCISCKSYLGKKVYLCDNSGKVIRELFTVTEDKCDKYYDFKTGTIVK